MALDTVRPRSTPAAAGAEVPEPPAPSPSRAKQPPDVPRRTVLTVLGTAAVATAFRANIAADALYTDSSQYRVTTPDNDANRAAADRFPGKSWYLLGGFAVSYREAARKLEALQRAMNERAPASYIGYSNNGIDIASLFIAIQQDAYVRKLNTVYLYGDSFGGMAAVVLGELLEQNGIHVRVIIMGSSPSTVRDVLDPSKEYISLAGRVVPYLGLVGRLSVGLWNGLANPNGQGMYAAARSGLDNSLDRANSSLILKTTQATFLQAFPAQYDGGILHDTGIGLLYDPEDFIVNARTAKLGWASLFPHNPVFAYDIPHTGHASPEIHPDIYGVGLRVILDELDPRPRTRKPLQPIF